MDTPNKIAKIKCPLCKNKLEVVNKFDNIKMLKCTECRCEIHFSNWDQQRKFTGE